VARARLSAGKAPRRGGARPGARTPHGNRIDANCACGRPFERKAGPRRRRGINGPFTGFTFGYHPGKDGEPL
jgi:hypothetical protein